MRYNFFTFFNKSLSAFVCNSYPEKESLKTRKENSKSANFIYFLKSRIDKYSELPVFHLFVIKT